MEAVIAVLGGAARFYSGLAEAALGSYSWGCHGIRLLWMRLGSLGPL